VYLVEADGGESRIRTRNAEPLVDVRPLDELVNLFSEHGFVRIHRSFIVNIARVRRIRPREREGWELNLDPPVNRVLPVAEDRAAELWASFGES
jgi:DNA-binding LytR/AlgR family response regulator